MPPFRVSSFLLLEIRSASLVVTETSCTTPILVRNEPHFRFKLLVLTSLRSPLELQIVEKITSLGLASATELYPVQICFLSLKDYAEVFVPSNGIPIAGFYHILGYSALRADPGGKMFSKQIVLHGRETWHPFNLSSGQLMQYTLTKRHQPLIRHTKSVPILGSSLHTLDRIISGPPKSPVTAAALAGPSFHISQTCSTATCTSVLIQIFNVISKFYHIRCQFSKFGKEETFNTDGQPTESQDKS